MTLEPHAAKGLPTTAVLAERFSEIAPGLLRPPATDTSVLGRLLNNASRLVEIRRVGESEGSGTAAVVARIESKMNRGDLAGAVIEAEQLPESAKAVASAWLTLATHRRDAERTVRQLIDATLATGRGQS
jgi:hypothetical protein